MSGSESDIEQHPDFVNGEYMPFDFIEEHARETFYTYHEDFARESPAFYYTQPSRVYKMVVDLVCRRKRSTMTHKPDDVTEEYINMLISVFDITGHPLVSGNEDMVYDSVDYDVAFNYFASNLEKMKSALFKKKPLI